MRELDLGVRREALDTGSVCDFDVLGRGRHGKDFPVLCSVEAIDVDGEKQVLAVIHDTRRIEERDVEFSFNDQFRSRASLFVASDIQKALSLQQQVEPNAPNRLHGGAGQL